MNPSFETALFQSHLCTSALGRNVVYKAVTATTMEDALQLGKTGSPHGTLVLAEQQTQGRGYKGHQFNSTNSGNIYATFVLHRPVDADETMALAGYSPEMCASLSSRAAIQGLIVPPVKVKWPNDLWIRGHKVAGFLQELSEFIIPETDPKLCLYVLGMGINVNSDVRRDYNLSSIATSVACERLGRSVSREMLLAAICNSLEEKLTQTRHSLYDEYLKYPLFEAGQQIKIHEEDGCVNDAELVHVTVARKAVVKFADGEQREILPSALVSIRPKPSLHINLLCDPVISETSSNSLRDLLLSVIDTSKISIQHISISQLDDRCTSSQVLVIGNTVANASDMCEPRVVRGIQGLLDAGGTVFFIGNGTVLAEFCLPELPIKVKKVCAGGAISLVPKNIDCLDMQNKVIDGFLHDGNHYFFEVPAEHGQVIAEYKGTQQPAIQLLPYGHGRVCLCGVDLGSIEGTRGSDVPFASLCTNLFMRDQHLQNVIELCFSSV